MRLDDERDPTAPDAGARRAATRTRHGHVVVGLPTLLALATLAARCQTPPPEPEAAVPPPRAVATGETEPRPAPPLTRRPAPPPLRITAATGALARADLGDLEAILASAPDDRDPAVAAARRALRAGTAWRATRAITPALRDPARATPTARLLAAVAAAGWGGWPEVERALGPDPGALPAGHGWSLLARAALARDPGASPRAADAARRAVAEAPSPRERGVRLVVLATALDRLGDGEGARTAWYDAALDLPGLADWLTLRGTAATADRSARERAYADLASPAARARVAHVEATARERGNDPGAAAAWVAAGAPTRALVLRLMAARRGEPGANADSVRSALLQLIAARAPDARRAVALLDSAFAPLTPAEELLVARAASETGPAARAAAGYAAAAAAGLGSDQDRLAHGSALAAVGRHREAAERLARVGGSLAGRATFQRGRSLLRSGRGDEAVSVLRGVPVSHPNDTTAAASALWLLADLAVDGGRTLEARQALLDLARRYPTSDRASDARFRAALLAYTSGGFGDAASELEALRTADTASDAGRAAGYWAGRAWAAAGQPERARAAWTATLEGASRTYYGMLAARRLGRASELLAAAASAPAPPAPAVDTAISAALTRAATLDQLGLDEEAGWERDWAVSAADTSWSALLAVAAELQRQGLVSRGIRLGQRALERGAPASPATFRILFPLPDVAPIAAEARARGVDPWLAAALVWQESRFTTTATSPVGARGLMQVMPSVGRQLASGAGYPAWDPALLWQPDVSVELGMRHLAAGLRRWSHPAYALAAYNAGDSRVVRWRRSPGSDDPELFVERIPFVETRDYVRIVLRNRAWYESLHGAR